MSGFEVLGMLFSIILALCACMSVVWIIGSIWRNNRDIDELLLRIKCIENGLIASNSMKDTKGRNK